MSNEFVGSIITVGLTAALCGGAWLLVKIIETISRDLSQAYERGFEDGRRSQGGQHER